MGVHETDHPPRWPLAAPPARRGSSLSADVLAFVHTKSLLRAMAASGMWPPGDIEEIREKVARDMERIVAEMSDMPPEAEVEAASRARRRSGVDDPPA